VTQPDIQHQARTLLAIPIVPVCMKCQRRHRHWSRFAKCALYDALITGEGRYAALLCSHLPWYTRRPVHLFDAQADAEAFLVRVGRDGCRANCRQAHKLLDLAVRRALWTDPDVPEACHWPRAADLRVTEPKNDVC
jgi:hypothetical protein